MSEHNLGSDSPTVWIEQLRQGNGHAAQKLWEAYFEQLVQLARRRLQTTVARGADEEDVALSTFQSFFRGLERGRFPQLNDRFDLWKLLVSITFHKISHLRRDEGRQKRGGGWNPVSIDSAEGLPQLLTREPSPEMAAELVEQFELVLGQLPDRNLQQIALWKMEGFTNAEIAERLQIAERTVERKLNLIREIWQQWSPASDEHPR